MEKFLIPIFDKNFHVPKSPYYRNIKVSSLTLCTVTTSKDVNRLILSNGTGSNVLSNIHYCRELSNDKYADWQKQVQL